VQQAVARDRIRGDEYGDTFLVQFETFGGFLHAVAEPDAQRAVDTHAQPADEALLAVAHIPSRPSSVRAASITAGVISPMPRSLA